jgi:hypothetical protein
VYTIFAQYRDQPARGHIPVFVCDTPDRARQIVRALDRLGFVSREAFVATRSTRQ